MLRLLFPGLPTRNERDALINLLVGALQYSPELVDKYKEMTHWSMDDPSALTLEGYGGSEADFKQQISLMREALDILKWRSQK